jgi:mannitol 2-dehydrogenase
VQRLNNQTLRSLSNAADPPRYDRHATRVGIAHIGVGAFHRSHQAMFLDRLRRLGRHEDWGIAGIGLFPAEASTLDRFTAQDGLYTLLLRRSGKPTIARIIGSLTEYVLAPEKPDRAMNRLTDKATKIVSLTITEGGYALDPETGAFDTEVPAIARDLDTGDRTSVFGLITAALDERRIAKTGPFTVMSCDNIQGNGHVARRAFTAFARCRSADLANWITENVAFPNSMVDRITPVPTEADSAEVAASYGYVDQWALAAEPFLQWVLEDDFCAGRPDFEQAGVQLVDDVTPYEKLKLRLLNASHQVISHFGRLLGYTYVHTRRHRTRCFVGTCAPSCCRRPFRHWTRFRGSTSGSTATTSSNGSATPRSPTRWRGSARRVQTGSPSSSSRSSAIGSSTAVRCDWLRPPWRAGRAARTAPMRPAGVSS